MKIRKNEFYELGRKALTEAIDAFEHDKPLTRREVEMPDAPADVSVAEILKLRTEVYGVSQHVFAKMLNVAPKTIQGWEQGRNKPTGATLKFIRLLQEHPRLLKRPLKAWRSGSTRAGVSQAKPASGRR